MQEKKNKLLDSSQLLEYQSIIQENSLVEDY